MRRFTLLLLMFTPACGWVEGQREAAAQAASAATLAETAQLLSQTLRTAEGMARSADRVLRPLPVMTPAEEAGLRRFLNPSHVARARALGVRVEDRVVRDSLLEAGRLVLVEDSTSYWIVRPGASPAYLVPGDARSARSARPASPGETARVGASALQARGYQRLAHIRSSRKAARYQRQRCGRGELTRVRDDGRPIVRRFRTTG